MRNDVLDAGDLVVFIDSTALPPDESDPLKSFESDGEEDQAAAAAARASNAL